MTDANTKLGMHTLKELLKISRERNLAAS